jgi:hypothetical protein
MQGAAICRTHSVSYTFAKTWMPPREGAAAVRRIGALPFSPHNRPKHARQVDKTGKKVWIGGFPWRPGLIDPSGCVARGQGARLVIWGILITGLWRLSILSFAPAGLASSTFPTDAPCFPHWLAPRLETTSPHSPSQESVQSRGRRLAAAWSRCSRLSSPHSTWLACLLLLAPPFPPTPSGERCPPDISPKQARRRRPPQCH